MRTPSLSSIKAHFRRFGITVEHHDAGREQSKFVLLDKKGCEWGSFDCPCALWWFWRDNAARVLFEDICIRRFLTDFRRASKKKRQQMADGFINRVNGEKNFIDGYLEPPRPISADRLPRNWKQMLQRNLNGDVHGLPFFSYVRYGMNQIDPSIEVRKSELRLYWEAIDAALTEVVQ